MNENDRSEKKISRQPTFSSFTPQPRNEKEYAIYKNPSISKGSKILNKSDRNLSYQEGIKKPLLLSLSGTNINADGTLQFGVSSSKLNKPDSYIKSSDITHQQFFISSDTKNFNMSSEGSKKYRSPTFEAISEEENNSGRCIVDSPTYKRLSVDMDCPERFMVKRDSRRPPSIHAALNPNILSKDLRRSDPDMQDSNIVHPNNSKWNEACAYHSNKLLLKAQEGKFDE